MKTYEYDDANRLKKTTDRLNRVIEYTYNDRNQLTQELWKNSVGTVVDTLSYNYNDDGQMLSATKGGVGYSFTYDNLARLKTQTDIYGLVQTFTYNAANDRMQVSTYIFCNSSAIVGNINEVWL